MWNARLDDSQAGIKSARINVNLSYEDDTTLMAEIEEKLKSLLMRVKVESEKLSLASNSTFIKLRLWHPVPSLYGIEGEKVEAVTEFLFLGSKITADNDCRHEIKRCVLLVRKVMTNVESILKNKDIMLLNQVLESSYVFSSNHIQIRELDNKQGWAPKNWCFWILVLEKILESPLDCMEIKPVNPKGNPPWNSLKSLMLKLKL